MTKKFITSFDDSVIPNVNEFRKSFEETYLWVKHTEYKEPILLFIKEVDGNSIHTWNNKYGSITIPSINDYEIWVEWPETGYFSHNIPNKPSQTLWFSKQPSRQWKKAPCSTNCSITASQYYKYTGSFPNFSYSLNIDILSSAYEKDTKTTLQNIIELVKLFNREFIINKKYLLTPEINPIFKKTTGLLWFYFKPVARINLNTSEIVTLDSNFKKEVLQLFKENS